MYTSILVCVTKLNPPSLSLPSSVKNIVSGLIFRWAVFFYGNIFATSKRYWMPSSNSIKASFRFVSVEAILSTFLLSNISASVQTTGSVTKA